MESGIYYIRNKINNKYYIGQSIHVNRREAEHFSTLKRQKHENKHLQSAWNKYGNDNFEFCVIEYCECEDLDEREIYWIDYYKSKYSIYNFSDGGQGISGYKHSDEEINKMRKIQNPLVVLQFDENMNFIKRWEGGVSHIHKELKSYTRDSLTQRCLGNSANLLYKNSYWIYEIDYDNNFDWNNYLSHNFISNGINHKTQNNNTKKKIDKLDMNMNYICTYDSIVSACIDIGASSPNISKALTLSNRSCKGFKWKYHNS